MNRTFDALPALRASETKMRILDAAEGLFAERGYDAASLRAITAAAGVNLAAVNYHFRSKQALLQAVFARKLGPLSIMRLDSLGRYEAEAGGSAVPLAKIFRALLEPIARFSSDPTSGWDRFRMLVGRMYTAPRMQAVFLKELEETIRRFRAALQRACPGLPFEDLCWKVHFVIGAMAHTLASGAILEILSEGKFDSRNLEAGIEHLIAFAAAGFKAPVLRGSSKQEAKRGSSSGPAVPVGVRKQ